MKMMMAHETHSFDMNSPFPIDQCHEKNIHEHSAFEKAIRKGNSLR